jgi:hypothetical protein
MNDQDTTLNEPYPNPVAAFDVEGLNADPESADGDTDTEGHRFARTADAESVEGDDDVTGHVFVENRDDLNSQRLR